MYKVSPLPLTFTFNCVDGDAVRFGFVVVVDFVNGFDVDVNDLVVMFLMIIVLIFLLCC